MNPSSPWLGSAQGAAAGLLLSLACSSEPSPPASTDSGGTVTGSTTSAGGASGLTQSSSMGGSTSISSASSVTSTTGTSGDVTSTGSSSGGTTGTTSSSAGGMGGSAGGTSTATSSGGTGGDPPFVEPTLLSETGLYTDIPNETLGQGVMEYAPAYELWSDGAAKRRWVFLPEGVRIDSYFLDYWNYPVGTKLWKEFSRDGVRVETRLLQKIADEEWFMVAFQWNDEGTDAVAVPEGQSDAKGTQHDIPNQEACAGCHANMPDRVLGFTAVQLSHQGPGVTLDQLVAEQRLNSPPSTPLVVPGNETERAALGYLHANCGHCHNDGGVSEVFSTVDMVLWLQADELAEPAATSTYLTTVERDTQAHGGIAGVRVVPGSAEESVLYQRFTDPDPELHMPPLGTEIVDEAGLQLIEDWISALQQ